MNKLLAKYWRQIIVALVIINAALLYAYIGMREPPMVVCAAPGTIVITETGEMYCVPGSIQSYDI